MLETLSVIASAVAIGLLVYGALEATKDRPGS